MELMILIFWLSSACVIYVYLGYPLTVRIFSFLFGRPPQKDPEYLPRVTVIIAAFNEEKNIRETIENKLALDYPADRLEILVVSDESTDRTDQIVEEFATSGVVLIRQVPRQGKTAGVNLAVPASSGDVILFSDANSMYESDALREIVSNFSDSTIGYVTGKMIYANEAGNVIGDGCSAYMRYENYVREHESRIGSVVGVDGGIDAIRADLYQPMEPGQLPDFVQPLKVVEQGFRVVYEKAAILVERSLSDSKAEYRMRVRVTLRALWGLWDMRALLNPGNGVVFAWQLWSHKLLRYMAFIPIIASLGANVLLALDGPAVYKLLLIPHTLFYVAGAIGYLNRDSDNQPSLTKYPYYFLLVNVACMQAFFKWTRKEKIVIWNPRVG